MRDFLAAIARRHPVYGNGYTGQMKSLIPAAVGFGGTIVFTVAGALISSISLLTQVDGFAAIGGIVVLAGWITSWVAAAICECIDECRD